ncbi:MAG: hypothetical protein K2X26_06420 [Chitinophagaceae bacterium]|nr:hypothetical protein [Chitinophagaceae bacterium]
MALVIGFNSVIGDFGTNTLFTFSTTNSLLSLKEADVMVFSALPNLMV